MKTFFSIDILRLKREYSNCKKYSHLQVLKQLTLLAFDNPDNTGFLPMEFDIKINLPDVEPIKEVLSDLGCPSVRNIQCFTQSVHVHIV